MTTHPAQDSAGSAATGVAEDWHAAADWEQLEEFGLPSEPDMPTIETQDRMAARVLDSGARKRFGEVTGRQLIDDALADGVFVELEQENGKRQFDVDP